MELNLIYTLLFRILFTLNLPCRFKVTNLTFIISSFHFIFQDTFTFVGYKYKVSVIQAILWSMLSKVFIFFRFRLPNGREDHGGESRGQLITSLLANTMEPQFYYCYSPPNPNPIFCHSPTNPT